MRKNLCFSLPWVEARWWPSLMALALGGCCNGFKYLPCAWLCICMLQVHAMQTASAVMYILLHCRTSSTKSSTLCVSCTVLYVIHTSVCIEYRQYYVMFSHVCHVHLCHVQYCTYLKFPPTTTADFLPGTEYIRQSCILYSTVHDYNSMHDLPYVLSTGKKSAVVVGGNFRYVQYWPAIRSTLSAPALGAIVFSCSSFYFTTPNCLLLQQWAGLMTS